MDVNIPKIIKITLNHLNDYIEEIIVDRLKYLMHSTLQTQRITMSDIIYKIVNLKRDDTKPLLVTPEYFYNETYKDKQLSKIDKLKNIKFIIINDNIVLLFQIIDTIIDTIKIPKFHYTHYEAWQIIKNKNFKDCFLLPFDINFYLEEIFNEISKNFSPITYNSDKLKKLFKENIDEIPIDHVTFYDFILSDLYLNKFNGLLTQKINCENIIKQLD